MPTPVLNNGIFMRETNYTTSSHVDSYHMLNLLKDSGPMDIGPVDLWAFAQKIERPLYQISSFGGKNIINVSNPKGEWKWQIPLVADLPYFMGDIEPANAQKGIELINVHLVTVIFSLMTNTMELNCMLPMMISSLLVMDTSTP